MMELAGRSGSLSTGTSSTRSEGKHGPEPAAVTARQFVTKKSLARFSALSFLGNACELKTPSGPECPPPEPRHGLRSSVESRIDM